MVVVVAAVVAMVLVMVVIAAATIVVLLLLLVIITIMIIMAILIIIVGYYPGSGILIPILGLGVCVLCVLSCFVSGGGPDIVLTTHSGRPALVYV